MMNIHAKQNIESPRQSRWRKAASGAIILVIAAVLIYWLQNHIPSPEERSAPVMHHGQIGKIVSGRGFMVKIPADEPILSSRLLEMPDSLLGTAPKQIKTTGIWLAVPVELETATETMPIVGYIRTRSGKKYGAIPFDGTESGSFSGNGVSGTFHQRNVGKKTITPGFAEKGYLYFEVPKDELEGMRAYFYLGPIEMPLDSLIVIDLGIDAKKAEALRADAKEVVQTYDIVENKQ